MAENRTSLTLLESIKANAPDAWTRLDGLYRPFLRGWFRHRSIPDDIAEDITQQVMLVVFRELPNFDHSGRTGALRKWLTRVATFEEKAYWRKRSRHENSVGGSEFHQAVGQLEDSESDLSRYWDEQHDQFVLQKLLDENSPDFEPQTMAAFKRFALEGEPIESVANELKMSSGAIYVAKSRVLRRLRSEAAGLVDETCFS